MTGVTVMQVLLHDGTGGAETLARQLHTEWGSRAVTVSLERAPGNRPEAGSWPAAVEHAPFASAMPSAPAPVRRVLGLRRLIRQHRPDVLVAHSALPAIYARLACRGLRGAPAVCSVLHSAGDDFAIGTVRRAERVLAARTAAVIAVSEAKAEQYVQYFPAMRARLHVVPNGIVPGPARPAGPLRTPARLLATSRLHPQKDIATMLHGFARYLRFAGRAEAVLSLAGSDSDPEYAADMRAVASRLGLANSVRFLGARDDVPDLLAEADVFVHSAVREAAPISLLEAAATGLPMLVSELPELRELPPCPRSTFPVGDPDAFAGQLHRLLGNYEPLAAAALQARDRVLRERAIAVTALRYDAVLADVAGRR